MALSRSRDLSRATLVSALLRPDRPAPAVSTQDSTIFVKTLLNTLDCCTRKNIQLCKSFIVKYVLPSTARTAALAKFLLAISKTFAPRPNDWNDLFSKQEDGEPDELGPDRTPFSIPFPEIKRHYALYLIHDLLSTIHARRNQQGSNGDSASVQHQTVHGVSSQTADLYSTAEETLKSQVPVLFELAACRGRIKMKHTTRHLRRLSTIWKRKSIFSPKHIKMLTGKADAANETDFYGLLAKHVADEKQRAAEEKKAQKKAQRWIIPKRHGHPGNPYAQWWELPAGNFLYMKRTRGYPMRADAMPPGGYPSDKGGQEASPHLKKEVTKLYNEILRCYDEWYSPEEVKDVDEMGNIVWKDPERPTRNCYGWTLEGIPKRKELAKKFRDEAIGYDDIPRSQVISEQVDDAVERARSLASAATNRAQDCHGHDYRGQDYRGSDYRGSDYRGSDYRGSDYRGSDYRGSDYRGSGYRGSDQRGSDYRGGRGWRGGYVGHGRIEKRGGPYRGSGYRGPPRGPRRY